MAREKPTSELLRLLKEQTKALEDEVFGGLSSAERAEYNRKTKRINELEIEIAATAAARKGPRSARIEQRRQWNKESETDTPQNEASQPYRSREKDPMDTSAASRRKGIRVTML